jgi:hypothetical protein
MRVATGQYKWFSLQHATLRAVALSNPLPNRLIRSIIEQ